MAAHENVMVELLTLHGVQELFFSDVLQLLQDYVWAGWWVVRYREVGHRVAVGRRALEGTAKGLQERQKLGDGGQGALGEEGELQMVCGRFLTQPGQSLKRQDETRQSEVTDFIYKDGQDLHDVTQ